VLLIFLLTGSLSTLSGLASVALGAREIYKTVNMASNGMPSSSRVIDVTPAPRTKKSGISTIVSRVSKGGREATPITFMSPAERIWIPRTNSGFLTHNNAPLIVPDPAPPSRVMSPVKSDSYMAALRNSILRQRSGYYY